MRIAGALLMTGLLAGILTPPVEAKDVQKAPATSAPAPIERDDYLTHTPMPDPLTQLNEDEARFKAGEKFWVFHSDGPDTPATQADFDRDRATLMKQLGSQKTGQK